MRIRLLFVILLLLYLIVLSFLSMHPSSPLRPFFNQVAFSLGNGKPSIRLWGEVRIAESDNFPNEVKLNVTGVSLHPDLAAGVHHACIDWIQVDTKSSQVQYLQVFGRDKWHIQDNETKPICIDFVADADFNSYRYFPVGWEISISNGAPQNAAYFNYPYDEIIVKADFVFSGFMYDENGQVISSFAEPASQTIGVNAPGWDIYEIETPGESLGSGIVLRRPLLLRILAPTLIAMLLFVTLCIPFVDAFSTAIEIAVALIIGIWGIRQIILPTSSPGFTAIDIILVGEYGAIIIAVLGIPLSRVIKSLPALRFNRRVPDIQNNGLKHYVGLINSKNYHLQDCPTISRSSDAKLIKYKDKQEAENSGKRLCNLCRVRNDKAS